MEWDQTTGVERVEWAQTTDGKRVERDQTTGVRGCIAIY